MAWLNLSPDFNPIENVWDKLQQDISASTEIPTKRKALSATLVEE
jgi:transposase